MSKEAFMSSSFQYKEQNPDYQGEQLDPEYARGPVEERPCTDVICLLVFLVFIGGMVYVAVLAFMNGDPRLLAIPFDESGKQCKLD